MTVNVDFEGAEVLTPEGLIRQTLSVAEGQVVGDKVGRSVDLSGFRVLPGIVDVHGDGFERHVAPRRGAMKDIAAGLMAAETELAANGVTTGILAQFISWEAGLRGLDFAEQVFAALADIRPSLVTDLRGQVRLETHLLEVFDDLPAQMTDWGLCYLVFNDHLPHARLEDGRKPPRLNGQALRAGRSPEQHLAEMQRLHARSGVEEALDALAARLMALGVRMGSHDDSTAQIRAIWRARGATVCEFPETLEAAEAAHASGDLVVMGAPNIMRGGSHNGNVSALDLVAMGLCDALASDYHYPSLRRAALFLAKSGVCDLAQAWALVSSGPARVLGLSDRGVLRPEKRADLVVLDENDAVVLTMVAGRVSFMSGDIAERFLN